MDSEMAYICVSRPRRFGKSVAANMLCAYYTKGCDSESLFQNQKIAANPSFREHLNQYNVLLLNIQQFIRGAKVPENLVNYIEQKVLDEIKESYKDYVNASETSLPDALTSVYTKDQDRQREFIIIIDEWDCIFREMKGNANVQKTYLDFLRDLLKGYGDILLVGISYNKKTKEHNCIIERYPN